MELFEKKFYESMWLSKVRLIKQNYHYSVNRKGKQMRPMFVFLTAKMINNGESKWSGHRYRMPPSLNWFIPANFSPWRCRGWKCTNGRGFFSIMPYGKIKLRFWWVIIYCPKVAFVDDKEIWFAKNYSLPVSWMSEGETITKWKRQDV